MLRPWNRQGRLHSLEIKKKRRRLFIPEIAILLVSTCICLILAEISLRVLVPFDTNNSSKLRIPHPVFGWSLNPNVYRVRRVDDERRIVG